MAGKRGGRQPESGKQYGKIAGFVAGLYPASVRSPDALESGKGEDSLPGLREESLQVVHHGLVGLIQVTAGPYSTHWISLSSC